MKYISDYYIKENRGDAIDQQWINDQKPVMTKDGRQAMILDIDMKQVPNVIKGQVNVNGKAIEYEWTDDGTCIKATDKFGNPKQPDDKDVLVKGS